MAHAPLHCNPRRDAEDLPRGCAYDVGREVLAVDAAGRYYWRGRVRDKGMAKLGDLPAGQGTLIALGLQAGDCGELQRTYQRAATFLDGERDQRVLALALAPYAARKRAEELRTTRRRQPAPGTACATLDGSGVVVRLPDGTGWSGIGGELAAGETGWTWQEAGVPFLTHTIARALSEDQCRRMLEAVRQAVAAARAESTASKKVSLAACIVAVVAAGRAAAVRFLEVEGLA